MKTKLLFILSLFLFITFSAQKKYVIGNVKNELQFNIPETYIYNPRTEELTTTDISGNFIISAISTDELRIVKNGYERISLKISEIDFTKPLEIVISKLPYEIPEVELTFKPTGNLKKDLSYFKTSERTVRLNSEMSNYMMTPLSEVSPQNKVPSAFAPPNYGQGQVNVLGVLGAVSGLLNKATTPQNTTPTYSEVQDFYRRVKDIVDISYFRNYGMNEYDFEIFLAYVDEKNSLAKRFRKNFNKAAIESELKMALADYLKTHKINS